MCILHPWVAYLPGSVPKDGSYPEHIRHPSGSPLVCLGSWLLGSGRT